MKFTLFWTKLNLKKTDEPFRKYTKNKTYNMDFIP